MLDEQDLLTSNTPIYIAKITIFYYKKNLRSGATRPVVRGWGLFGVAMDDRRGVYHAFSLQGTSLGITPNTRLWSDLGYLGPFASQDLPLTCTAKTPLDSRHETTPQPWCPRSLLLVRPRAGAHRPHCRVVLLLPPSLVEYPIRARCRCVTDRWGIHPTTVELMENALERRQEMGSRHPLCACGMGAVERAQCQMFSQ
jgi:hypothetical protein